MTNIVLYRYSFIAMSDFKMKNRRVGRLNMTEKEKRNKIVKEVIKPLIKSAGYKCSGTTFYRECHECYVIIYLQSSQFNNEESGFSFWFNIGVLDKKEVVDINDVKRSYGGNSPTREDTFLPDNGLLNPYRSNGYSIGGMKNGQRIVTDYDDAATRISNDISQYILSRLDLVQNLEDWDRLMEDLYELNNNKRNHLLSFFYGASMLACSLSNKKFLVGFIDDGRITKQEVLENMDLLQEVLKYTSNNGDDVEAFVMYVLQ